MPRGHVVDKGVVELVAGGGYPCVFVALVRAV
jgi:hypothetical protein